MSLTITMHKYQLDSNDALIIEKEAGKTRMGDNVPSLEVSVSEMHSVNISDFKGTSEQSVMVVSPLRLADGTLRPVTDPEPEFHPDAHFLIRITGPSMTNDKYHQFDKNGNYLG